MNVMNVGKVKGQILLHFQFCLYAINNVFVSLQGSFVRTVACLSPLVHVMQASIVQEDRM